MEEELSRAKEESPGPKAAVALQRYPWEEKALLFRKATWAGVFLQALKSP